LSLGVDRCALDLVLLIVWQRVLGLLFLLHGQVVLVGAHALLADAIRLPAALGEPSLGKATVLTLILYHVGDDGSGLVHRALGYVQWLVWHLDRGIVVVFVICC
jgi:hypothetical protein